MCININNKSVDFVMPMTFKDSPINYVYQGSKNTIGTELPCSKVQVLGALSCCVSVITISVTFILLRTAFFCFAHKMS